MLKNFLVSGIIILSFVMAIAPAQGASVSFAWDPPATGIESPGYRICYGTSSGVHDTVAEVGLTTSYTLSGLIEGTTYYIVVKAYNSAGESGPSNEVVYTPPDATLPVLAIATPTNQSIYATSFATIAMSGNASDNIGVTGVTWANAAGGSGSAAGTTSWSISAIPLAEGENVITVTASDKAGNQGKNVLRVIYIPPDVTLPVLAITAPTNQSIYATSFATIAMSGNASDNIGVTGVTWANAAGGSGSAAGTTSWSISAIPLAEGENVITVTASDKAGNQGKDVLRVTCTPIKPPKNIRIE